ncbi:hypothetical protein G6F40_017519 [Rhizopus arrhizus]|nr:hypothetical protein G6F40_017519 [Rhizopus arrhizus]
MRLELEGAASCCKRWKRKPAPRRSAGAAALAGAALRVSARAGAADHHQQRRADAWLVRHRRHGLPFARRHGQRAGIGGAAGCADRT